MRALRADALVVAAYGLILPQPLLEAGRHGAFNIHASLLPRWRGAAPIQRALWPAIARPASRSCRWTPASTPARCFAQAGAASRADDDAGTLHDRLAALGAELIVEALAEVEPAARAPRPAADASGVTYARKIEKRETRLDWTRPAAELERAVRAFRPAPGAYAA